MRFVALGGFLGAGKTTTMLAAGRRWESAGERVSVITNDQGADLVDSQLAAAAGLSGRGEVTGGCFCCRFEDLAGTVLRLRELVDPTAVLAEAVGSCTDLQSTVLRPLRRLHGDTLRVGPLTTVVDPVRYLTMREDFGSGAEPDLAHLYRHQLDEADIIAVNKADLLDQPTLAEIRADLAGRFPAAHVVVYSAARGDGLDELLELWARPAPEPRRRPFPVDYVRYGAAEAELAWTNQTFTVTADGSFSPAAWTDAFLTDLAAACRRAGALIGHVKVRVATGSGAVRASLVAADGNPIHDATTDPSLSAPLGEVTLNARVRTDPDALATMIDEATGQACAAVGAQAGPRLGAVFRPAFPVPVHRM